MKISMWSSHNKNFQKISEGPSWMTVMHLCDSIGMKQQQNQQVDEIQ